MNLEELSKKDKKWREVAYKICKCKSIADDLVQEMYLRIYRNENILNVTDWYICKTIESIFLNSKKSKKKQIPVDDFFSLKDNQKTFDPDDKEIKILDKVKNLSEIQKDFISMTYDYSLRNISKETGVSYGHVFREVKKARKTILGEDLEGYKNKRLKYRN